MKAATTRGTASSPFNHYCHSKCMCPSPTHSVWIGYLLCLGYFSSWLLDFVKAICLCSVCQCWLNLTVRTVLQVVHSAVHQHAVPVQGCEYGRRGAAAARHALAENRAAGLAESRLSGRAQSSSQVRCFTLTKAEGFLNSGRIESRIEKRFCMLWSLCYFPPRCTPPEKKNFLC